MVNSKYQFDQQNESLTLFDQIDFSSNPLTPLFQGRNQSTFKDFKIGIFHCLVSILKQLGHV